MPQGIDYAALAEQARKKEPAAVDYAALDAQARATVQPDSHWYTPVVDLVSQLQSLNPAAIVRGVSQTAMHPLQAVQAAGQQNADLFKKAEDSFKAGDYTQGVRHLVNYVVNGIPGVGARLDEAGDDFARGDYAKGTGKTLDTAVATMGPKALSNIKGVPIPGIGGTRLNPAEARAVAFGESRSVPMDAATATGRPIVSVVQKRTSDSMGGAGIAEGVKAGQASALERVGGELSRDAHPTVVDPVTAGEGVRNTLTTRIQTLHAEAGKAYDALRQFEQKAPAETRSVHPGAPVQSMKLAVDVRPARQALTTLYTQLSREKDLVGVLQGGKARALVALDALMNGPDFAPLSEVDGALGELKAMSRGAAMPELRTGGQAAAAEAVKHLDAQVRARAAQAGPQVLRALEDGRAATRAKYMTADTLEQFSTEPRKVFDMLVTRKDGAIEKLRAIQREAPDELPKIGRAYLEDMMQRATAEGSFGHADALWSEWQKLGPETKRLIFDAKPDLVRNVDNFLLLAKRIAANPNPSGTARVMTAFNLGSVVPSYALAKLFYTPKGVALLQKGLSIPVGSKAAAAAYLAELTKATGEASSLVPATAGAEDRSKKQ